MMSRLGFSLDSSLTVILTGTKKVRLSLSEFILVTCDRDVSRNDNLEQHQFGGIGELLQPPPIRSQVAFMLFGEISPTRNLKTFGNFSLLRTKTRIDLVSLLASLP